MAKIPQGILGGIRGRVGNIVGGAWKGINYIRSMPLSVANPNTTLQQAQRGAFTQTVLVARLLLADLIATFWDPFARLMSGYNHFISVNIHAFATSGLVDYVSFFASRGILTGIPTPDIVASEAAGTLAITWTDNTGSGDALGTDLIRAVWYNETQDYWDREVDGIATRADEAYAPADIKFAENDIIKVWVFFVRPDLEKISDSVDKSITAAA